MTLEEFRQYRQEQRAAFIAEGKPRLEAECAGLFKKYLTARKRIQNTEDRSKRKQLTDDLYAQDGIAWQWARVDAQLSTMTASQPTLF